MELQFVVAVVVQKPQFLLLAYIVGCAEVLDILRIS